MTQSTAHNPSGSKSSFHDPDLYRKLPTGMRLIYSHSGLFGVFALAALLWFLADPGLAIYGHPESTPIGGLWHLVTGSDSAYGTNILRYTLMIVMVAVAILFWPLMCGLGMVIGFSVYFLTYWVANLVYVYPFQVMHTLLFSKPEAMAYRHIPDGLMKPTFQRRHRREEIQQMYLYSFVAIIVFMHTILFA